MKKQIPMILIILAISSMACSITLPFDWNNGDVGEVQTFEIAETYPGEGVVDLTIEMGGGNLNVEGNTAGVVAGTVRYNVEEWKPEINWDDNKLVISQDISTVPIQPGRDIENEWNITLGNQPIALTIRAGAYDGTIDLSGIPLTDLEIRDGASNAEIFFNEPNPVRMESFLYRTGASDIEIRGLANANAGAFTFNGGAGQALFDFSGTLQHDMLVEINGGVGNVRLIVPEDTNAVLQVNGDLLNVDNDGWEQDGDVYSIPGTGARIIIEVNMSVGNLELDTE